MLVKKLVNGAAARAAAATNDGISRFSVAWERRADVGSFVAMQPPGTILVVDDRESNRHLLKEMLESAGHIPLCANDGAQAIELAVSGRPDLILLDVKMPGMDGYEVCVK